MSTRKKMELPPKPTVTIVGHPFANIGMGTHLRSVQRSLRAARTRSVVLDVYGQSQSLPAEYEDEFGLERASGFATPVNIFCLNGDEIAPALKHLGVRGVSELDAHNIVYPAWELTTYPQLWAAQLNQFDEVWAESAFVEGTLRAALGDKVRHMPLGCEAEARARRSRASFGIPDDDFVFLLSFDFSSYMERKNPFAAVAAFDRLRDLLPRENVGLVIKVKNGESRPDDYREFRTRIAPYADSVTVIDETLTGDEMHTLVSLCDSYVSLHRSEGFGLGIAEAMYLGRPPVCTAWSGNMDYCTNESAQLVDYTLVDVQRGQYPFWQGQQWAEADITDAAAKMADLVTDVALYREKSMSARLRMRRDFSYLALGLRYKQRIDEVLQK